MKFMEEYDFHMSHQWKEYPTTIKVAISCTSDTKGCLLYPKSKRNSWKDLTIAFVTCYPARLPRWTYSSLYSITNVTWYSPLPHHGTTAQSQSVWLLWTNDQPNAETSTWQHTTLTRDRHTCHWQDLNLQSHKVSSCRPTPWTTQPLGSATR